VTKIRIYFNKSGVLIMKKTNKCNVKETHVIRGGFKILYVEIFVIRKYPSQCVHHM